jgi:hypothetical protein
MNHWQSQHLDDGQALRYLDGELPARKSRQVRRHLEACWQCREEVKAMEATVAACMEYRKQVVQAHVPEPPQPWPDLSRRFDWIDAELSATPFWRRLGHISPALAWSTAAAMAALLVCAIYYQLRETPSVQAAVLLKKAVAAAESQPLRPRHYRIRTANAQVTRTAGGTKVPDAPLPPAVAALFAKAHYDAADPLSARAFVAWRDQLSGKHDEVGTVDGCYELRTITGEGNLASATLRLRVQDFTPVEGKLEFRDRNWIELVDLTELPGEGAASPVASLGEPPLRSAVPSRPAAIAPGRPASISDELQVLAALHGIGADLGDPVQVRLADGHVEVSGVGVSPERRRQIRALVGTLPHVEVAFSDPGAAPAPNQATVPETAPVFSPSPQVETRLEQQLGGRAELEKFGSRVVDWNEAAMARAYALRGLAQRFPAATEGSIPAEDRRMLRQMAREHSEALGIHLRNLESVLSPVLANLGGAASARTQGADAADWQAASEHVFQASHRLEVQLSLLLGVGSGEKPPADLPGAVRAALQDLRTNLTRCQALLAQ